LRVPRSAIPWSGRVASAVRPSRTGINERDSTWVTGNELSPQRKLRIPVQVYKRASALALGCNTVPVFVRCTLRDLRYYIVTLHCRRSSSVDARRRRMTGKADRSKKIGDYDGASARARARARRERKKRRSFEKREIGLPRTSAPRSFRRGIRTGIRFPWEKSSPRPE